MACDENFSFSWILSSRRALMSLPLFHLFDRYFFRICNLINWNEYSEIKYNVHKHIGRKIQQQRDTFRYKCIFISTRWSSINWKFRNVRVQWIYLSLLLQFFVFDTSCCVIASWQNTQKISDIAFLDLWLPTNFVFLSKRSSIFNWFFFNFIVLTTLSAVLLIDMDINCQQYIQIQNDNCLESRKRLFLFFKLSICLYVRPQLHIHNHIIYLL